MPAVPPQGLVAALLDAFEQSGHSAVLLTGVRAHPRKLVLLAPDGEQSQVWVYAWTLTHGGRPSLPNEYRIQMTSVSAPLAMNPTGPTVLIGYEPNLKLFAGFDLRRHRDFTEGSPSVQIDIRAVRQALDDGLAFDPRSRAEVAVGIRGDQFMTYALNATDMHRFWARQRVADFLYSAAALDPLEHSDMDGLRPGQRALVVTISRALRTANFRQQVLQAYDHRCAVTRLRMRSVVQAARILGFGRREGMNHVRNGIALSPTCRRAFDKGLIFLDESYHMRVAPTEEARVVASQLRAYAGQSGEDLGRILLPLDRRQWPSVAFIRRGNQVRRVPASCPA